MKKHDTDAATLGDSVATMAALPQTHKCNVCVTCGGFGGWYDGQGVNAEPFKCPDCTTPTGDEGAVGDD